MKAMTACMDEHILCVVCVCENRDNMCGTVRVYMCVYIHVHTYTYIYIRALKRKQTSKIMAISHLVLGGEHIENGACVVRRSRRHCNERTYTSLVLSHVCMPCPLCLYLEIDTTIAVPKKCMRAPQGNKKREEY